MLTAYRLRTVTPAATRPRSKRTGEDGYVLGERGL